MAIYVSEPFENPDGSTENRKIIAFFNEKQSCWNIARQYPDGRISKMKSNAKTTIPIFDDGESAEEWLFQFAGRANMEVFAQGENETFENEPEFESPVSGDSMAEIETAEIETAEIIDTESEPYPPLYAEFSPDAQHTRAVLAVVTAVRRQLEETAVPCSIEKITVDGDAVTVKFGTSRPADFTPVMNQIKERVFLSIFPAQGKLPFDIEQIAGDEIADIPGEQLTLDGPMPPRPESLGPEPEPQSDDGASIVDNAEIGKAE